MAEKTPAQETSLSHADAKAKLLDMLYDNAETRGPALKLIKQVAPHVKIPEVDTPAMVDATMKPYVEKLEKEVNEFRADREARERTQILTDYGIDPSEAEKVTTFAKEKGISDLGTAADYYQMRQAAEPRPVPDPAFLVPDNKELFQDPRRWALKEATNVLNEFRQQRGHRG